MKKSKTAAVTVIVVSLFSVIYGGLYLLYTPGFTILTALLTIYGFVRGTSDFYFWLGENDNEDEELAPPVSSSGRNPDHARRSTDRPKRMITDTGKEERPIFDFPLK